ncbi:Membrane protein OS=Streptomyces antimycoticus OX=68175 GN=SANT12839_046830 PE=4 SV=1 [Streptomyces antimycoticus]
MSAEVVHSLGIPLSFLAAALYTVMAMVEAHGERGVQQRLAALLPGAEDGRPRRARPGRPRRAPWRRWRAGATAGALPLWAAPGGAVTIAVVLVGGPPGWVLGLTAAWGLSARWQRHRRATAGRCRPVTGTSRPSPRARSRWPPIC